MFMLDAKAVIGAKNVHVLFTSILCHDWGIHSGGCTL